MRNFRLILVMPLFFVSNVATIAFAGTAADWKTTQVQGTDGRTYTLHQSLDGTLWSDVVATEGRAKLFQNLDLDPVNFPTKITVIQKSAATEACRELGELVNRPLHLPSFSEYRDHLIVQFDHKQDSSVTGGLRLTHSGFVEMHKVFSGMYNWFWSSSADVPTSGGAIVFYADYGDQGDRGYIGLDARYSSNAVLCVGH